MSHAVVASSLGAAGAPERPMPARYWVTLAIVAAMPDADVIAFWLNVDRGHILSHRGLTHSLPFAAIVAALLVRLLFRGREWHASWARLWAIYFVAMASHGVLDAFTNGGQGIAFFAPLSARALACAVAADPRIADRRRRVPVGVRPARPAERNAVAVAAVAAGRGRGPPDAPPREPRQSHRGMRRPPREEPCDVSWRAR